MKQFINKFYQEKVTPFGTRVRFVKDLSLPTSIPLTNLVETLDPRKVKKLLPQTQKEDWNYYWNLGLETVKELETEQGILASGKNELFGAVFGRDSLITSLKLLKVYEQTENQDLLAIVRKSLLTLCSLQGKEENLESGEEPGKCIHEFRSDNHSRVTELSDSKPWLKKPWFVYPDGSMRNYDSVDATPLFLITLYRYLQISKDREFFEQVLANVISALAWVASTSNRNRDSFLTFQLDPAREYGGLPVQNWMDSEESLFHEDGTSVIFPVASVEVQAYVYLTMRLWSKFFEGKDKELSEKLFQRAYTLKKNFNKKFVLNDSEFTYLAFAVDGADKPMVSPRSSMGHTLWASLSVEEDGELDSIVEQKYVKDIVNRLLQPDLFIKEAGIMTLSSKSRFFDLSCYHNGTIWPHDNSLIMEGLEKHGHFREAQLVRQALLSAFAHFKMPLELYVYDTNYRSYVDKENVTASKAQAWSAATILKMVAKDYAKSKRSFLSGLKLKGLTTKALNWLFIYN